MLNGSRSAEAKAESGPPGNNTRSSTIHNTGLHPASNLQEHMSGNADGQGTGPKLRKRDRLKKAIKPKNSTIPEKDIRKPSGSSESTLRDSQRTVVRSPNSSQHDIKAATGPLVAYRVHAVVDAVNDGEVLRRFTEMEESVTSWSHCFVPLLSDHIAGPNAEDQERLNLIAPDKDFSGDLRSLLQYPSDRRQIAKGYVYRILYERVFLVQHRDLVEREQECTDHWLSKAAAQAVYDLENIFKNEIETAHEHDDPEYVDAAAHITPRELNMWRAYTMSLLSHTCVAVQEVGSVQLQDRTSSICQAIWRVLGSWIPSDKHPSVQAGLREIVTTAVMVMRLLRQQRAYWTIAYPDWNTEIIPRKLLFNPATMHARDTSQGGSSTNPQDSLKDRAIELMIRPALFKRGDASGNKLDVETCLVRAEVRCRQA